MNSARPIAVGPCRLFKKQCELRPRSAVVWFKSLLVRRSNQSEKCLLGEWVDSFLTLYSDSTLCVRGGNCERSQVVAIVKLVDVYRQLLFGESLCVPKEVPTVSNKFRSSMLGVPNQLTNNTHMIWLYFFSKHTLNKWLVAFCRAIPTELLNEFKVAKACYHQLKKMKRDPPSLALKNHIHLFFPSREFDPEAGSPPMNDFKISVLPNRQRPRHSKSKKHRKRINKCSRGSRSQKN
ncbi:hypothetical protein EGW08_000334 [Elysia chlorotica]|uniref:Uncharacterized protein n=1 Tax=Elysia chlorotica TaxID=188477 RepID=A0A3S1BYD1_ELYCH|nr:hypothetical protein EGW08_000334 [Elysia chlorotica]